MNPQRNQPIPLIGRGGVQLVAGDASIGLLALPLAALVREILGAVGSPLGVPAGGPQEFDRFALWSVALLSIVLWPLALRAVDPGYPSSYVPIRRIGIAVALWLLAGSGAIYLVDKELASRALVLFAAGIAGGLSLTLRVLRVRSEVRQSAPRVELPMLSGDAERSLSRGEPVAISIARLERALRGGYKRQFALWHARFSVDLHVSVAGT
ncbi:MAG: hypothetical protein ACKOQO_00050 [Candidatus Limnocylindrus sp.]